MQMSQWIPPVQLIYAKKQQKKIPLQKKKEMDYLL
jgi:hypothetical protein